MTLQQKRATWPHTPLNCGSTRVSIKSLLLSSRLPFTITINQTLIFKASDRALPYWVINEQVWIRRLAQGYLQVDCGHKELEPEPFAWRPDSPAPLTSGISALDQCRPWALHAPLHWTQSRSKNKPILSVWSEPLRPASRRLRVPGWCCLRAALVS